jgi:hypothetical protein
MTVTTKATVKVRTPDLRAALASVYPHRKRTKKDDDIALHRIRLTLANGKMYAAATQGTTTALAKMSYVEGGDTRGNLWEPDDGPLIVDLQPRQVLLINQAFSAEADGDAEGAELLTAITVDTFDEVELENNGGLNSAGERLVFPYAEPHELFPDVIELTGRALAEAAGESERAKTLKQDGKLIGLFQAAGDQYGAPLRWRSTGTSEAARGFVVECGSAFVGTISSTQDDEGVRRDSKFTTDWLFDLKPRSLASA